MLDFYWVENIDSRYSANSLNFRATNGAVTWFKVNKKKENNLVLLPSNTNENREWGWWVWNKVIHRLVQQALAFIEGEFQQYIHKMGTPIDSSSNELNACSLVYLAQHKSNLSGRVKQGYVKRVYIIIRKWTVKYVCELQAYEQPWNTIQENDGDVTECTEAVL